MKKLTITEEEKKRILSLHQNLNIKGILQEGLKDGVYTTDNDNKIYFGTNTYYDSIDIPKGTKFKRYSSMDIIYAELKDIGRIYFDCVKVGTVQFEKGTGNKHFTYKGKTYWANDLQQKLISVFCSSHYADKKSCKGNCENGYGELTFTEGGVYKGTFKNGKFNGYGTYTSKDGFKYQGNYKDGKWNGYGTVIYNNGENMYQGDLKDGSFNGKGKYTSSNGTIWWGEFNMDETTEQTYYKNVKGCYFKGKGGRTADGYWSLNGKDSNIGMDKMECTPGQWIDLKNQGGNNNSESNQGGNNNSGSNQGGNNNSGSNQGGQKLCSNWNNCSKKDGTTNKFMRCDWCSEIGRLQACLRDKNGNPLKTDKAWGKNTEAALNKLGYNGTVGITSADITKICDDLLANQTKFNPGDFGDGSDENFPPPQPDTK